VHQYTRVVSLLVALIVATPAVADLDVEAALKDRIMGDPNAPVTIIEYASLTCPHCAGFHNDSMDELKQRYIDTGKAKLIFRDFPLDGLALRASMMARCAEDDRYFGFIEVLFRSQSNWAQPDLARGMQALQQIGRLGGMSAEDFEACMENEELIDGILTMRQEGAETFDIGSTPSFVINGKTYPGAMPVDEFAAILDPLIAAD
jgi:protein-disulfide isomerase